MDPYSVFLAVFVCSGLVIAAVLGVGCSTGEPAWLRRGLVVLLITVVVDGGLTLLVAAMRSRIVERGRPPEGGQELIAALLDRTEQNLAVGAVVSLVGVGVAVAVWARLRRITRPER